MVREPPDPVRVLPDPARQLPILWGSRTRSGSPRTRSGGSQTWSWNSRSVPAIRCARDPRTRHVAGDVLKISQDSRTIPAFFRFWHLPSTGCADPFRGGKKRETIGK